MSSPSFRHVPGTSNLMVSMPVCEALQKLLREAGEGYEKLRGGIGGELAAATNGHMMLENGSVTAGRGLESL